MQETWVLSLGLEYTVEEEMATHSGILAWKISWTERLVGYIQSIGSQSRSRLSAHKHKQGQGWNWPLSSANGSPVIFKAPAWCWDIWGSHRPCPPKLSTLGGWWLRGVNYASTWHLNIKNQRQRRAYDVSVHTECQLYTVETFFFLSKCWDHASTAGDTGLIPGGGAKISPAVWRGQKDKEQMLKTFWEPHKSP